MNATQHRQGNDCITITHGGVSELFVNVQGNRNADPGLMFDALDQQLAGFDGSIARTDIIGRINNWHGKQQQEYCFNCGTCPFNEEHNHTNCPMTGVQCHAVSGVPVKPVWLGDRIVGTTWEDKHARYCELKDVHPGLMYESPGDQVTQVLELIEHALGRVDMDFHNVVRKWFFCHKILDWYDELNAARHAFFTSRGVFDRMVPASTGVGGRNVFGSALTADVFAVAPKSDACSYFAVPSPLQCPALKYGSSFSRATEVDTPDLRRLFISGTASIEPGGKTAHVGDVRKQVDLTLQVVYGILESRQMGWEDVTRGVAYFLNGDDIPVLEEYCREAGLPKFPVVVARNTVCRDDLLFELEVDAVKTS